MGTVSTMKYYSIAFCFLLMFAEMTASVPYNSDYENIRDLYQILFQKENLENQLNQPHQLVRKSNRSPTLRLRFGKKGDPYLTNPQFAGHPIPAFDDFEN